MLKKRVVAIVTILITTVLLSLPTNPTVSGEPPAWAKEIMNNTEIIGLANEGEEQVVRYLGEGAWTGGSEVWFFAIWRLHRPEGSKCMEKDLQAHIELAKIDEGVYRMEIYHSWKTPTVTMPYDYTTILTEPHLLVLEIEANL